MAQADGTPSTPQPLRALTLFDHVPEGCILQPVTDDDSAPHLRVGEFAIVDTTDTEPQHGEVYLVRVNKRTPWMKPGLPTEVWRIEQLIAEQLDGPNGAAICFFTRCLNFEP